MGADRQGTNISNIHNSKLISTAIMIKKSANQISARALNFAQFGTLNL